MDAQTAGYMALTSGLHILAALMGPALNLRNRVILEALQAEKSADRQAGLAPHSGQK